MSLNAVPPGIETVKVQAYLKGLPGVWEVDDLHIWSMSTTETTRLHQLAPIFAIFAGFCDGKSLKSLRQSGRKRL